MTNTAKAIVLIKTNGITKTKQQHAQPEPIGIKNLEIK